MPSSTPASSPRFADFDWLRVTAILVLHVFHTGMMFNSWKWHIKAPELLPVFDGPMEVSHLLRMPLLMLVAGAGTALAMRKRTVAAFATERIKRLLLPVVFGMLVVVPPQIYVERLFRGQFQGSYAAFWPSVLRFVPYPAGSLSWHHLWFVVYLFLFCMAALPLFALLNRPLGQKWLAAAEAWLSRGVNVALLFVALAIGRILLRRFGETDDLIHDPRTLVYYGQLFLYGHLFGRCPAVMEHIVKLRWKALIAALVIFALMAGPGELPFPWETLGSQAFVWFSLLTFLGFARSLVKQRSPWLAYAQERAYPFYILHQTVIIVVGYRFLTAPVGAWARFGIVLGVSFVITCALCELVGRVTWLRPLFGMGQIAAPSPQRKHATLVEQPLT